MTGYICSDVEGIFLYCGKEEPKYNEETQRFESVEDITSDYDWIESSILDTLQIKYPKNLSRGKCLFYVIKARTRW